MEPMKAAEVVDEALNAEFIVELFDMVLAADLVDKDLNARFTADLVEKALNAGFAAEVFDKVIAAEFNAEVMDKVLAAGFNNEVIDKTFSKDGMLSKECSCFVSAIRRCLPFVGIVAASAAVNGLVGLGGTATPASALGHFVLLLCGLSLATHPFVGA